MKIPSDNRWTQTNNGDFAGTLHDTQNASLDAEGKIKQSRKMTVRLSSDTDSAFGYVLSITYLGGLYFVLTDDAGFTVNIDPSSNYTKRTLSTDVGRNSDAVVCYDRTYITTNDNLDYFDTSYSLTQSAYATTADVPHPMAVFDSLPTYKLCVGNGNTVVPLDNSHNDGTILTLPAHYQVTTLAYRNGYLYVGTKHLSGGEAKVFIWDGATANANFEVPTGASWVYSIIPYKESVAFATNQGQLFVVSGNSGVQVAAFPVYYDPYAIWDTNSAIPFMGKILHRGMVTVGDDIWLNVNGTVDSGFVPDMKSGLWVFDPQKGLYHRSYHSLDHRTTETPSNLTNSVLTISTHNLKDGDLVYFLDVGSMTGIDDGVRYYAKVESSTTIKLAKSLKALKNEKYVTIGGTLGTPTIAYTHNTDWAGGEQLVNGAITIANPEEIAFVGNESPVLWGASVNKFDGTNLDVFGWFTHGWNISRFTIQRIYSDNLSQVWQKLAGFIDGCHLDNEKIIVKYKTGDSFGYPTEVFRGTWASATTIDSVSSTQDEDQWTDLEVGDELTIVDGTGRGYTTHITAIDDSSAPSYTITVDESIGTATNAVYFYADKFHKVQEIDNTRVLKDFFKVQLPEVKSAWIQLKFELRGFEIELSLLDLVNQPDQQSR